MLHQDKKTETIENIVIGELQAQREEWSEKLDSKSSVVGFHTFHHETKIKKIFLTGERHSGTSFFTKLLVSCFPDIQVGDIFLNVKHWFQPSPEDSPELSCDFKIRLFDTCALIDWSIFCQRKPHHWPNHVGFLPISDSILLNQSKAVPQVIIRKKRWRVTLEELHQKPVP
jgi:hypothetical protein